MKTLLFTSPAEKINSLLETAGGRPATSYAAPTIAARIELVREYAARWWTPEEKRAAQLDLVFPGRFRHDGRGIDRKGA